FVLPSLAEGLSNALLEAMACGLPVVATKVSGTVDVIEEGVNGFLVEPGNPEALAEAMAGILKDEGLAYRMGQANRKKILEKYSLDKIVDEYLSLYKRLMAE
ncbi:MAG TPA: glycosyltransferase family 4 protein, partial [bacterium]|nr:glycosyltransferase family 4 protein [bacterium]